MWPSPYSLHVIPASSGAGISMFPGIWAADVLQSQRTDPACAQTTQTFLTKSLDDKAFIVRPLALHDLPSTFTHIHLWIFFFYSADAYVCLSARALHELNGGAEEGGIVLS